jgi:hypothetical protein
MSTFNWVITDATEDYAPVVQGGAVDLEDAKVVTTVPPWHVQPPDGSVALVPQPGGEVELAESHRDLRRTISPWVVNFAVIVLVVVTGFILVLDVWRENVTFERFLYVLTSFIAGFRLAASKHHTKGSSETNGRGIQ